MKKFIVETYYTCTFKTLHKLNDLNDQELSRIDSRVDGEVEVIDKKGFPYLGVGEVVAGPTGAAISNALCKALGQRIKILPFTKDNITKELLN